MGCKPAPETLLLPLAPGFSQGREQLLQPLAHTKSAAIGGSQLLRQPPVGAFAQGQVGHGLEPQGVPTAVAGQNPGHLPVNVQILRVKFAGLNQAFKA